MKCRVELDGAGWRGWPRYTCHTHGVTLLRKPFHGDAQWDALRKAFVKEHGDPKVTA